jgi:hypothetical protein
MRPAGHVFVLPTNSKRLAHQWRAATQAAR